jgi:pimeloyl-ACP methyl ester carboxylesterase
VTGKTKKILMKTLIILGLLAVVWALIAPGCMSFRISDGEARKKFEEKGLELQTFYLKVNNRKMHYVQTGSDSLPTIFFVHGSPGSWNAFMDYMGDKDLLQHYRMISVDRPGFGYSNYGKAEHLDVQARLISPVLREINNNKPVYLVGHSLGGPMVIKLAADNPDIIDAIVILSGSVDPKEELPEKWRKPLDKTPLNYFIPGSFRPSNRELMYFKQDVYDLLEDFAKVKCRVYLIHGEKDKWVPPGNVTYAKQKLTNAKSVDTLILKGSNHFIPWTRMNDIKEVLMKLKSQ